MEEEISQLTQRLFTQPDKKEQLVLGGLTSGSSTYQVQSLIMKGAFGQVAKCLRMEDMKIVAVKMIKKQDFSERQTNRASHRSLSLEGCWDADLKPENVMLVNHLREPFRVKIIDFGLACNISAARMGSSIQNLFSRSPEIILGYPFTEAIDMWSLGCMAASMFLGNWLYPGRSEYDMIRFISETQGQPPHNILSLGFKTSQFFER